MKFCESRSDALCDINLYIFVFFSIFKGIKNMKFFEDSEAAWHKTAISGVIYWWLIRKIVKTLHVFNLRQLDTKITFVNYVINFVKREIF